MNIADLAIKIENGAVGDCTAATCTCTPTTHAIDSHETDDEPSMRDALAEELSNIV